MGLRWGPKSLAGLIMVVLIGIGVARITATYNHLNQTYDEPAHIGRGLEWWFKGTYNLSPGHPPLAPLATGMSFYLNGLKPTKFQDRIEMANEALHQKGDYYRNLGESRAGILPFFILTAVITGAWAWRLAGEWAGVGATLLVTTLPPVLANSGVATTDGPLMAGMTLTLFCLALWLDRSTPVRSLGLGLGLGIGILSKLSVFVFFPACLAAMFITRLLVDPDSRRIGWADLAARLGGFLIVAGTAFMVVWAGYRFSVGHIFPLLNDGQTAIEIIVAKRGGLVAAAYTFLEQSLAVPFPELYRGLFNIFRHVKSGHPNYFLGEVILKGRWYFFPVVLAVKTPLAGLALAGIGKILMFRQGARHRNWLLWAPVAALAGLILVVLPSTINIGSRHILPVFPLLAVIGGVGAVLLWRTEKFRTGFRVLTILLLGWQVGGSLMAHPDYLSYFNLVAAPHAEEIIVDSDLDWGQYVKRLSERCKVHKVDRLHIAYFGSAVLEKHDLPPFELLEPGQKVTGWVAISLAKIKFWTGWEGYKWLEEHRLVETVGRGIRLYYVPEPGEVPGGKPAGS